MKTISIQEKEKTNVPEVFLDNIKFLKTNKLRTCSESLLQQKLSKKVNTKTVKPR